MEISKCTSTKHLHFLTADGVKNQNIHTWTPQPVVPTNYKILNRQTGWKKKRVELRNGGIQWVLLWWCTWHSYGRKAMLISFKVLIFLAAHDLHSSLNSSSGQTADQSQNNGTVTREGGVEFIAKTGQPTWICVLRCKRQCPTESMYEREKWLQSFTHLRASKLWTAIQFLRYTIFDWPSSKQSSTENILFTIYTFIFKY